MSRIRLSFASVIGVIAIAVAIIFATSGGSARTVHRAVTPVSTIAVKQTSLGKTLTDGKGRTLYLFLGDKRNVSRLSAAGRAVWPPVTVKTKVDSVGQLVRSEVGTIRGTNGTLQATYFGHPLYYFLGDHQPGQTRGQGLNEFGARWYVLAPTGKAITSASAASAPSIPRGYGSGYGY
jgi:predicted lipoprotein with Yx(FWY)xxD motif